MIAFPVARLALLLVVFAIGPRGQQRCCERRTGADRADTDGAKESATADCGLSFVLHRMSPGPALSLRTQKPLLRFRGRAGRASRPAGKAWRELRAPDRRTFAPSRRRRAFRRPRVAPELTPES